MCTAGFQFSTRNVFDCDQPNYCLHIIFSYTFTLEPNMKWIRRPVAEIWPFEIFQDGGRRHLGFGPTRSCVIRSTDHENPELESNTKWIGWPTDSVANCEITQIMTSHYYFHTFNCKQLTWTAAVLKSAKTEIRPKILQEAYLPNIANCQTCRSWGEIQSNLIIRYIMMRVYKSDK